MNKLEKILISISLLVTLTYGFSRFYITEIASETLLLSHLSVLLVAGFYLLNNKLSISTIVILSFLIYPIGCVFRMYHWPLSTLLSLTQFIAMLGSSLILFSKTKTMKEGNGLIDLSFLLLGLLSLSYVLVPFFPFAISNMTQIIWLMILFTSIYYLQFTSNLSNRDHSVSIIKLLMVNSFLPTVIVIADLNSI